MRIGELIDRLRKGRPLNFVWGSGCSGLYRPTVTVPTDPEIRKAAAKYDGDPLLSEIKRRFFHRTAGLEDVHSCLLALNDYERRQVLYSRTTWAEACMAELLRLGRVARVLTSNFDGGLVKATTSINLMAALYRRDYPELEDASTPCIYLLGPAGPGMFGGLVQRGAATGPWVVIGCSGRSFGLGEGLRAVERFAEGLYWVGHFDEEPAAEPGRGFFSPERNAHWISGFDADSFMAYLLRGLGEFPPRMMTVEVSEAGRASRHTEPGRQLEAWLAEFERQRWPPAEFREVQAQIERVKRAGSQHVGGVVEELCFEFEMAVRAGHSAQGLGFAACRLAEYRAPREARPLLVKAAELMEPDAPGDVMAGFAEVCSRLARFSYGAFADQWYARADACFAQMDFGPNCGAPLPYGHLPKWAKLLAEWSGAASPGQSEAIFEQARRKVQDAIAYWTELVERPRKSPGAGSPLIGAPLLQGPRGAEAAIQSTTLEWIAALHQRARMVGAERARQLLLEARLRIEESQLDEATYTEVLAGHLLREAEAFPNRHARLLAEAEEQFHKLLQERPDQAAVILCNWAYATGELAMARTGKRALVLYGEADRRFREAEELAPDRVALHRSWSSVLLREARERGGPAAIWERAIRHAELAETIETGEGAYNLACIANEVDNREGVEVWLSHSAEYGKIPRLSEVLSDVSFEPLREEAWFRELLDGIFDGGLAAAEGAAPVFLGITP